MGHYDRLSQTENDRCISLTRPSLGLPVLRTRNNLEFIPIPRALTHPLAEQTKIRLYISTRLVLNVIIESINDRSKS